METPKEYYYTYYSYEEWRRGYIGSRGCKCLPEEDIKYFGSFSDKTFKPTHKIILKSDYSTREEAIADEIILHQYFKVVENKHFANRAYQTSTKFYLPKEKLIENGKMVGKKYGKIIGTQNKLLGRGIFGLTKEQRIEFAKKASKLSSRNTKKEKKIKPPILTPEELKYCRIKNGIKSGNIHKENKTGVCGISPEEHSKRMVETNKQKWRCLETGYISNAGGLSRFQNAKGISTLLRERVE